jgi:hypothetical protein
MDGYYFVLTGSCGNEIFARGTCPPPSTTTTTTSTTSTTSTTTIAPTTTTSTTTSSEKYYYQGIICGVGTFGQFYSDTNLGDAPAIVVRAFSAITGNNQCFDSINKITTPNTNPILATFDTCESCAVGTTTTTTIAPTTTTTTTTAAPTLNLYQYVNPVGNETFTDFNGNVQNIECCYTKRFIAYSNGFTNIIPARLTLVTANVTPTFTTYRFTKSGTDFVGYVSAQLSDGGPFLIYTPDATIQTICGVTNTQFEYDPNNRWTITNLGSCTPPATTTTTTIAP